MNIQLFINQAEAVQNSLRSFLLALCNGNKAEADDLAQDTLIKAYLSADRYTDEGKFKSWVFKIAYNTFLNHLNSQRQYDPLDTLSNVAGQENTDKNFEHQQLYMALSTLNPKERASVSLYYLSGYSVKDISKITGSSESAVKKQLERGRTQLKNIIGK